MAGVDGEGEREQLANRLGVVRGRHHPRPALRVCGIRVRYRGLGRGGLEQGCGEVLQALRPGGAGEGAPVAARLGQHGGGGAERAGGEARRQRRPPLLRPRRHGAGQRVLHRLRVAAVVPGSRQPASDRVDRVRVRLPTRSPRNRRGLPIRLAVSVEEGANRRPAKGIYPGRGPIGG
eukprot:1184865-Prorocentrum_minimum.AAC.1